MKGVIDREPRLRANYNSRFLSRMLLRPVAALQCEERRGGGHRGTKRACSQRCSIGTARQPTLGTAPQFRPAKSGSCAGGAGPASPAPPRGCGARRRRRRSWKRQCGCAARRAVASLRWPKSGFRRDISASARESSSSVGSAGCESAASTAISDCVLSEIGHSSETFLCNKIPLWAKLR